MAKVKLRETRLNKGLSQETLADLIGMTQCNYSRRENGRKAISDAEWARIAKVLGVNKQTIYEANRNHTSLDCSVNVPLETIFEAENISIENSENIVAEKKPIQHYKIPKEIVDNQQEFITILKTENDILKKENQLLKEKLLLQNKESTTIVCI
jgi:transcriptional regulator with XRE-family HTH domain